MEAGCSPGFCFCSRPFACDWDRLRQPAGCRFTAEPCSSTASYWGALQLEPDEIRHLEAGQLLGRVLESKSLEQLALTGGFWS